MDVVTPVLKKGGIFNIWEFSLELLGVLFNEPAALYGTITTIIV